MNLVPEPLRGYRRAWLARDVIAGLTLSAVAIPEVMGYTSIAGTPIVTGLYTIIFPTLIFALLGSSRLLVVGADSATAAVLAAGLTGLGIAGVTPGSPEWSSPWFERAPEDVSRSRMTIASRCGFVA